jgi:hypothetical protein
VYEAQTNLAQLYSIDNHSAISRIRALCPHSDGLSAGRKVMVPYMSISS